MKHREIILGPPGTGKTRELLRRLEEAFEKGVMPEEVAYLAFTRKAADVAVQRACQTFGFSRNRFPFFRTIHSLAFHQNKISRHSVLRGENFKEMGEEFGWDFNASYENFEERPSYGTGDGDQLLQCYDLAKAKDIDPHEEARQGDYTFSATQLDHFVKQFEHYKAREGLLTFNDFLTRPVELDVKMVIIDEAQDLTHLQWEFVRNSFRSCSIVLIAGDDDQCIYQWSGADLKFFLTIDAHVTTLNKSFRCREQIWKLANHISDRIEKRYKKPWQPVAGGGEVDFVQNTHEIDLTTGEWLVLVRKNKLKAQYFNLLMNTGRVFHDGQCWTNERPWFRGALAYMKLRRGETVTQYEANALRHFTTLASVTQRLIEFKWEDVEWKFDGRPEWDEVADALKYDHVSYIRKCQSNELDIAQPGSIRLSTIHAAKGGEADNVLLDTKLDGIPLRQFNRDPDSERRVWYVGVSRARHKLLLAGSYRNRALS